MKKLRVGHKAVTNKNSTMMKLAALTCLGFAFLSTISAQDPAGDSGLKIDVISAPPPDCPRKVKKHDLLVLHYQGFFGNGTKFDSR